MSSATGGVGALAQNLRGCRTFFCDRKRAFFSRTIGRLREYYTPAPAIAAGLGIIPLATIVPPVSGDYRGTCGWRIWVPRPIRWATAGGTDPGERDRRENSEHFDSGRYATSCPHLLFEVQAAIRAACSAGVKSGKRSS